jgi:hypothetical protein
VSKILAYQQQLFNEENLIIHFLEKTLGRIDAQDSIPWQEQ